MDIFGDLLTTSGLIVDERITWLTFSSGYDFGYLLKSITLGELPKEVRLGSISFIISIIYLFSFRCGRGCL